MEALDVDFAADDGEVLDHIFAFGNNGLPSLGHDPGISSKDSPHRRFVVGPDVPAVFEP